MQYLVENGAYFSFSTTSVFVENTYYFQHCSGKKNFLSKYQHFMTFMTETHYTVV